MTDEALVNAIAEYPYLIDIYLYGDSVADGIEVSRRYFSALDELLSRETVSESLTKYGLTTANSYYAAYNLATEEQDNHDLFVGNAILDIFEYVNNDVNVTYMNGEMVDGSYIALAEGSIVPYSQAVAIIRTETHTNAKHDAWDQEMVDTYCVTRVSRGSCKYNCHSYAWYSQSTSNYYWINDPTPYMESGVYTKKYSGTINTSANITSVRSGDIIFYGDVDGDINTWHSAIYCAQTNTGAPLAAHKCISKWGSLGLFEHSLSTVPAGYDTSLISAWRG